MEESFVHVRVCDVNLLVTLRNHQQDSLCPVLYQSLELSSDMNIYLLLGGQKLQVLIYFRNIVATSLSKKKLSFQYC